MYYINLGCLNCTGMVMYWGDIGKRKEGLLDINQQVAAYFTEVTINNNMKQNKAQTFLTLQYSVSLLCSMSAHKQYIRLQKFQFFKTGSGRTSAHTLLLKHCSV